MGLKKNKINTKKMSKVELADYKKLEKTKSEVAKLRKKTATTLNWMDLKDVQPDQMVIGDEKHPIYVKGIRINPHNIFVDTEQDQALMLQGIRMALNRMDTDIYYGNVYSPVDLTRHINNLMAAESEEDDPTCYSMMESDLNKAKGFQKNNRELNFYLMIRNTDPKILAKDMETLFVSFRNAGLEPKTMNKKDFYYYLDNQFDSPFINDYYFSRGVFSYENQEYVNDGDAISLVDHTDNFGDYGDALMNIVPGRKEIQRSRIAPLGIKLNESDMRIGDKYVSNIYVAALPDIYYLAVLCEYLNNMKIHLQMKISRSNIDIAKSLRGDFQDKKQRYQQAVNDPTEQKRLEVEMESSANYIDEVTRNHDTTWETYIVFTIYADDLKEMGEMKKQLKQLLSMDGFKTFDGMFMQEEFYRMCSPIWTTDYLPGILKQNYGLPLPSSGVSGLYPWVFETLKDNQGFLIGQEKQNSGAILYDPFYYLNQPEDAKYNGRINGDIVVVGRGGSGKTTAVNMMIRNFIERSVKTVWIDPENKNKKLTKKYGGTYIDWGQSGNIINVFDLKPRSSDEDDDSDEDMWNTSMAIKDVINDVKTIFQSLFTDIDVEQLAIISQLVIASFRAVGIKPDENGDYPSFKNLSHKDMPTFETFNTCLNQTLEAAEKSAKYTDEARLLKKVSYLMIPIMNEWSIYFVGHTTVAIPENGRQIISFGTRKLFNAPENLQNALYYIMFTYAWSLCLDDAELSAFVIDEAHTLILKGRTAELVSQFYRRSRKYKNVMLIATQQPHDFADPKVLTEGKAIFNNAVYKLFLNMNQDDVYDISKLETINTNEAMLLQRFHQGDALFICGDRRIPIHVLPSPDEMRDIGAMFQEKY